MRRRYEFVRARALHVIDDAPRDAAPGSVLALRVALQFAENLRSICSNGCALAIAVGNVEKCCNVIQRRQGRQNGQT